jgi:hypothetical protein
MLIIKADGSMTRMESNYQNGQVTTLVGSDVKRRRLPTYSKATGGDAPSTKDTFG